jgi:hypothetical protein
MTHSRSRLSSTAEARATPRYARPQHAEAPTPKFGAAWAALLYLLCTLALMYPALSGGFLVSPISDQYSGYAYREFAASMLRHTGSFPLWNPYILGGIPYVAGMHGDIFYPTFLLRMIMPTDVAMTWEFGIHLFLAGMFTYVFLRAWGFRFYPALVGGVGYMLSGQVASLVAPGHDGKMYVSALTPLILWAILRGMRDGKRWAWGVLAIATGLCILSPQLQLTYDAGLLAGAFTLWLAFRKGPEALERRAALTRLAFAAVAAIVGLAIGAIQFLPFFEYIPYAARGTARGWEYATSFSMAPQQLIDMYLPQFIGILDNYWGSNPLKFDSDYIGAGLLVLVGAAFGTKTRRGFFWFWVISAIVALLVSWGGHTPFYHLWYQLPMVKVLRAPSMIYFIVSLAAACLAAIGMERILSGEIGTRYIVGWGIAAVVIVVLASVGVFQAIATALAIPERQDAVAANAGNIVIGAWRSTLFVALTLGALWLLATRRIGPAVAGWALAVIVAVDLWSVDRIYFMFSPPASKLYASNPAIEYLQRLPEPGRVISLALSQEVQRDPALSGDALMIQHVRTTTGHQGNELQSWVELAGAKSPAVDVRRILSPEFRRLTNTRFLYTNAELPTEIPQLPGVIFTKRVGPVQDAVGNAVFLYELNGDAPAAWVAPVIVKAGREPTLATVLDPRFDPRRAAIFDSTAAIPGVQITALPEPVAVTPRITRYEPGRISLTLDQPAPEGSALIVSENYYPGWNATVDGKAAPIGRADYTLIGVALPTGGRQVELAFHEAPYENGKVLTLFALGLSVLVIVAGLIADGRRYGGEEGPAGA